MIPNIYVLKPYKDSKLKTLAFWLKAHRISANTVTLAGLIFGVGAAACILMRQNLYGVCLLGLSISADLLDGTVARLEKVQKLFGKLFDAICDRVVEFAWIGALIITGSLNIWAITLVFGSVILLICRILAYRRQVDSSGITITRFERVVAMLAIVILPWRRAALWMYLIVTIGTFISSLQIIKSLIVSKPVLTIENNVIKR